MTPAQRIRFMEQVGISVVLEVGAHVGRYGRSIRDNGYAGRIESFEPLPGPFRMLQATSAGDPLWRVHNVAVGAKIGTMEVHVSANEQSSSALRMLPSHLTAAPHSRILESVPVELITLDSLDLLDGEDRAMLTLDVQGFESAVLDGATRTVDKVDIVEIELSTTPLYEGQALIGEQIERLAKLGFDLVWMNPCFVHPQTGRVLQYDGIFARR